MFRLRNKDAKFPELYPKVDRKDPTTKDKGWDKVGDFTLRDKVDFMPQKGLQEQVCACESNLIFMCGAMSMGKAQPYDAKVLTPNGFVDMGSLKVGDTISGVDGGEQKVLAIFEQGEKEVYSITFSDGAQTECCKEHLWNVKIKGKKSSRYIKPSIKTTEELLCLLNNGHRIAIPFCAPIRYNTTQALPIKPYTLGALLGDGGLTDKWNQMFTTIDYEIIQRIEQDGYNVSQQPHDHRRFLIRGDNLRLKINDLGLRGKRSWEKHIPFIYKIASIEDRLELIRGLFDTDGTISKDGTRIVYSTTSEQLALDVEWICRSLGCRCATNTRIHTFTYKGERKKGRLQYILTISEQNGLLLFDLPRKRDRQLNRIQNTRKQEVNHILRDIKLVGKKQCRCILVSNSDHLYITDDFIVTHNTYAMYLKQLYGIDKQSYSGVMISVRLQDSKKGSSIFRDAVEVLGNFAGCEYNSSDYPTFTWKQWNSSVRLIHSNFNADNPNEWEEFKDYAKKVQASYIAIDEATEIKQFKMFTYWFGRNRDASGMTPQMILSFNPEHTHWSTQMMKDAGYIGDDWYIKPEMIGKTRYFYIKEDSPESIIWGDTAEEVAERADIHLTEKDIEVGATIHSIVKSFTLFTGEAADNKKLVAATKGQSLGNLHAVGGTQRSIVKGAYFGPVDNEELNVTRQMIHGLWTNPINDDENMYATLDVSGGGDQSDNCPMVIWKGLRIVAIKMFKGDAKELVNWIDKTLQEYGVPISNFAFDATGIGNYLKAYSSGRGVTANKAQIQEYDELGNPVTLEQYTNTRSQLIGKTKVLFEMGKISCALDKDTILAYGKKNLQRRLIDILFDEINIFISTTRNRKIYYRHKDEYKAKFKSSPDLMDAICLRAVFELDARPKKQPAPQVPDDAYNGLYRSYSGRERAVWV